MVDRFEEFTRLVSLIRPCTMCNIPAPAYPIISGELGAKVMTVGQSPGLIECREGKPFAGTAGRTLFSWFAQAGIGEEEFRAGAYMTSITKCYPAPDEKGRRETPRPWEVLNCAPYLVRELRLIEPKVIIPIGLMAIERLLGPVKLSDVVGGVFERRYHSFDALVVPLPHPSGRSTWVRMGGNRELLAAAIKNIERLCKPLIIKASVMGAWGNCIKTDSPAFLLFPFPMLIKPPPPPPAARRRKRASSPHPPSGR